MICRSSLVDSTLQTLKETLLSLVLGENTEGNLQSVGKTVALFKPTLTLCTIFIAQKTNLSICLSNYESTHLFLPPSIALSHGHRHTHCSPTNREAADRKESGDGLIDPPVKMGDISPTSISIKPLRLEASQGLLLFLFRGELKKIYRQLMVSGRKALLEYIKSTYRRR